MVDNVAHQVGTCRFGTDPATPRNRRDLGDENAWQWVSPDSLAGVIGFLASAAARDIRGAAIPVYGKV